MEKIEKLLSEALNGGADRELDYFRFKKVKLQAFRGEIADYTSSENKTVSSRIIKEKRMGKSSSEKITPEAITELLNQAEENSRFSGEDEGNVLYQKSETEEYQAKVTANALTLDEKKARLLAAEKAALDCDPRIINVPGCNSVEVEYESAIVNSYGLSKSQGSACCYASINVMAREGDETQTAHDFIAGSSAMELDLPALAEKTARRALEKLGARELTSGDYPVVFDTDTASQLLSAFIASPASPFYGENIQKGRSMLAGKVGKKIGCDLFTIIDDPRDGITPVYFDADGFPTAPLTLVDRGVFKQVVHSLYSAAREEGAVPTGHAGGGGTTLHNARLEPGMGDLDGLIGQMGNGLLITEISGLHAGLNALTGDFSLSASGFMIKNGRKDYPVRNLVAAGNLFRLMEMLQAKADDAREINLSNLTSPSILIEELSISGK